MRKLIRDRVRNLVSLLEGFLAIVRSPAFLLHLSHDGAPRGVQVGHLEQIFTAVFGRPEAVTVDRELWWEAARHSLLFSALSEFHGVALGKPQFLEEMISLWYSHGKALHFQLIFCHIPINHIHRF